MINEFWQWLSIRKSVTHSMASGYYWTLWFLCSSLFWWPLDERMRVRPGKKVPVDGKIIEGSFPN